MYVPCNLSLSFCLFSHPLIAATIVCWFFHSSGSCSQPNYSSKHLWEYIKSKDWNNNYFTKSRNSKWSKQPPGPNNFNKTLSTCKLCSMSEFKFYHCNAHPCLSLLRLLSIFLGWLAIIMNSRVSLVHTRMDVLQQTWWDKQREPIAIVTYKTVSMAMEIPPIRTTNKLSIPGR